MKKSFLNLLHKSFVFGNEEIVHEFVTQERSLCLSMRELFMNLLHKSFVFDSEEIGHEFVTQGFFVL
jgi:hypothetical protein